MIIQEMTTQEISEALALLSETDACKANPILSSVLLMSASLVEDAGLAKREADSLALSIWERYYKDESPNFELCDSVAGVITQIDNMVSGLTNSPE